MDVLENEVSGEPLSLVEEENIFQIDAEPPKLKNLSDYIVKTKETGNMHWFLCYLHYCEERLNRIVNSFLIREGMDRYDPVRRLHYKMGIVLALLENISGYDPGKDADFLTYTHYAVNNAVLECRRQEEAGSFRSLDEYKAVRNAAWFRNNSRKNETEMVAAYAKSRGCTEKTARELLMTAAQNRVYSISSEEDEEKNWEDSIPDNSWNYTDILWDGIRADEIEKAFRKLSFREQTLLEKRNALCMTCGRTSPMSQRATFEDLAVLFEGSGAGGAERAYKKALEKLTRNLVEAGVLHAAQIRRISQTKKRKKITAAVWEYQADYDGEWGEIQFDFETVEITRLAEWDRMNSHPFARKVISYILSAGEEDLPKKVTIPFELYESGGAHERFWSWTF